MIRRFFFLLLMLLVVANQGQHLAFAHGGSGSTAADDHGAPSHFHVGGEQHRHLSHQAKDVAPPTFSAIGSPVDEHDANAVYCNGGPVTLHRAGKLANMSAEKAVDCPAFLWVATPCDCLRAFGPLRGLPPTLFDAACPIFLRTLSLRL